MIHRRNQPRPKGWFEEWCNWPDVCGWEYVEEHWEEEQ